MLQWLHLSPDARGTSMINPNASNEPDLSAERHQLLGIVEGRSRAAIRGFCQRLPELPRAAYARALTGMGYLYEAFDLMFAIIATNIQATHDQSDYQARFNAMQNVLRPFASEFGIEPDRPLQRPHRKLYLDFYQAAAGQPWPSHYPADASNPWLKCGRYWTNVMIQRLQAKDLDAIQRARYDLGYHWSVEYLSVEEFDELRVGWKAVGIEAPYMNAHCDVEAEHADCATAAIVAFTSVDDPLVVQGIRDHEDDLEGFYMECTDLIIRESMVHRRVAPDSSASASV